MTATWPAPLSFSTKDLGTVPRAGGVYRIRLADGDAWQAFPRLSGVVDRDGVLAFGESLNLRQRLMAFHSSAQTGSGPHSEGNSFYWWHGDRFAVDDLRFEWCDLSAQLATLADQCQRWPAVQVERKRRHKTVLHAAETLLFHTYASVHGELPPLNRTVQGYGGVAKWVRAEFGVALANRPRAEGWRCAVPHLEVPGVPAITVAEALAISANAPKGDRW